MKAVLFNIPTIDHVLIEDTCSTRFYGFTLNGKSAGYIAGDLTKMDDDIIYHAKFFYAMTNGNKWSNCSGSNVQDALKSLHKKADEYNHDLKVFEFDTYQELLKWGSEH